VLSVRVAGGEAAFLFELRTRVGEQTYTLAPIDVMTFDDNGKITSMQAYWSDADMSVS
jgi:steroid delta-isomerase